MNSYIDDILKIILDYNISNNFEGYDKFDGANNFFSQNIFKNSKWIRFFFQQLVKESPINLRRLLNIKASQNIKGNGIFINALIKFYKISKNENYLNEARKLLEQQLKLKSKEFKTLAWGHNFIWEGLNFTLPKYYPNITNTIITAEAILEMYKTTCEEYLLEYLDSITESIMKIFPLVFDEDNKIAISYFPFRSYPVCINIQAFTSAFLIKYFKNNKNDVTKEFADKLMNFVIHSMNDNFSWYYSYPKSDHFLKKDLPDNYHTAFILDSLLDYYNETQNKEILEIYKSGLDYYQKNLFTNDFEYKWNSNSIFPIDIHGGANSIITFSKASILDKRYLDIASKILEWTINNMFNKKEKYFIYRKNRILNSTYRLIRWSDAWMCYAISEYLKYENKSK